MLRPLPRPLPCWLLLLLWLLLPVEARAHAALVDAAPPDGATLAEVPGAMELRFDEVVSLIGFSVVGSAGPVVLAGPARIDGVVLHARLPENLPHGTYLASWRVISADGHPVAGTVAFGVGGPPMAAAPAATADGSRAIAGGVLRILVYGALLFGAGGALFRLPVAEPPAACRRVQARLALAGVPCALLAIGVQGGAMLAAPFPAGLVDAAAWQAGLGATPGVRALAVAAGLAAAWAGLGRAGTAARLAGAGGVVLASAGLGLSGHAAAGGWAMQRLLALHALAGCFWLGALPPLLALLAANGESALAALRRFSAIALAAVALLLLSGVVQGARHLPDLDALVHSDYGRLLLAKAGLVVALIGLAGLNRHRLTPALAAGRAQAAPWLRRSIRLETALAVAVLGVTAVLTMTNPHAHQVDDHGAGHGHAHPAAPAAVAEARQGGLVLALSVDPARVGANRLALSVTQADGSPFNSPEVTIELAQEAAGVVGVRRRLQPAGSGLYAYQGRELAVAGRWTARLEILLGQFDQLAVPLAFDVGPAE